MMPMNGEQGNLRSILPDLSSFVGRIASAGEAVPAAIPAAASGENGIIDSIGNFVVNKTHELCNKQKKTESTMILYSYYIIKFVKFVMKYDHDRMEKELRNELLETDEKG